MAYTRTPNLQLFTALTGGVLAAPSLVAGLLAQRAVFRTVRAACTMLRRATMSADHGRGRPDGEKRRWRRRRSILHPLDWRSSLRTRAATCRTLAVVASLTEFLVVRCGDDAGLLLRIIHLPGGTKPAACAVPASACRGIRHRPFLSKAHRLFVLHRTCRWSSGTPLVPPRAVF